MRQTSHCLVCHGPLGDIDSHYHPACSSHLFDQARVPDLPYTDSDIKDLAKQVVKRRTTVPGVQAKLSLQLETSLKDSSRLTIVGLWGDYILKPPVEKYTLMPEIENLTMRLATLFRITTVPHGLIPLKSGELAYITRRIDRVPGSQKRHMEDMCQLCGRLTEDKYRGSMEQIGKIIKR
jgi:serine/threonine-protein kinase HipA